MILCGFVRRNGGAAALVLAAVLCADAPPAAAGKAPAVLGQLGCAGCHRLVAPPPAERTLEEYAARKGPDLFYAGSKYRREWLRAWLAAPTPIRPAGLHPAEHTVSKPPDGDALSGNPAAHPAVPAGKLDAVVAALTALDWGRELLPAAPVARTPVPRALAEMNFTKFKGCGSCHRTAPSGAPASGPDLHDGYARLRPEFLVSFIKNPQAWDPVAPMPGYGLEAPEVGKLVEYLRLLSEGAK